MQDLIKKLGLKDENELQSYFIRRIDKFVTSKGKKLLGWEPKVDRAEGLKKTYDYFKSLPPSEWTKLPKEFISK